VLASDLAMAENDSSELGRIALCDFIQSVEGDREKHLSNKQVTLEEGFDAATKFLTSYAEHLDSEDIRSFISWLTFEKWESECLKEFSCESHQKNERFSCTPDFNEKDQNTKRKPIEIIYARYIRFESHPQDKVRIMKGNPNAKYPSRQQDYVKIFSNGRVIGKNGFEIKLVQDGFKKAMNHPDAHTPTSQWMQWKQWDTL
jgi:hypothetical protein